VIKLNLPKKEKLTIYIERDQIIKLKKIKGIILGWLYWKKGLESAMIAHFIKEVHSSGQLYLPDLGL